MLRRLAAVVAAVLVVSILHAQQPAAPKAAPDDTPLRTAGDRPIDIKHIRLDLKVDLPKKTVDGVATLEFRTMRKLKSFALDAVDFEVKSVAVSGKDIRFRHDGKKLHVDLPEEWPADKDGTLAVTYRVREPKDGLFFFGPTAAEPETPLTVWSQGEAVTNRYWFPCLDHPNQRQTTELVVTVADGYEVLSNGKLLEKRANPDGTATFHWRQEKPHVSYLVTLVVGKFAVVREEWNGLPVLYYVPPKRRDEAARTFGRTREMLDVFSKRFGIAYPWEKYAQVVAEQFTAGGMENTSATTLNDRALHDERAFLDSNADALIAHELAHQWWGDLVTCRDWAHIWLNEGFASFCEVVWAEHKLGPDEGAYNLLHKARAAIAGGKERPIVDRRYTSPRMMFDARAYPKGAWVLHMLRSRLGEDAFWSAVRAYGTENKFKSVETADFRRVLERETGRSLERFFYDWTERPGHPVLDVAIEYLPESKQLRIAVKQTQAGEAFAFPLPVRYTLSGSGERRETFEVNAKEQTFFLPADSAPTRVEIDPAQTVLAEIKETQGRDLWANQLLNAKSLTARIRAADHFGQSKTPADRELLARALKEEKFWGAKAEIAAALARSGGDTCRDALVAGLSDSNPKVRRACADQLGKLRNDPKAASALKALLQKGDASYFVEAAALRSYGELGQPDTVAVLMPWLAKESYTDVLRVAALNGLGASRDLGALDTLAAWTKRGKSRSARVAALQALVKLGQTASPNDAQRQAILNAVAACITGPGEMPYVRRIAVTALRDLGQMATPKIDVLEALLQNDPDEYVQNLAKRAIEQIRGSGSASGEMSRLRDELEKLKKQNQSMQERLDRMERKGGWSGGR